MSATQIQRRWLRKPGSCVDGSAACLAASKAARIGRRHAVRSHSCTCRSPTCGGMHTCPRCGQGLVLGRFHTHCQHCMAPFTPLGGHIRQAMLAVRATLHAMHSRNASLSRFGPVCTILKTVLQRAFQQAPIHEQLRLSMTFTAFWDLFRTLSERRAVILASCPGIQIRLC